MRKQETMGIGHPIPIPYPSHPIDQTTPSQNENTKFRSTHKKNRSDVIKVVFREPGVKRKEKERGIREEKRRAAVTKQSLHSIHQSKTQEPEHTKSRGTIAQRPASARVRIPCARNREKRQFESIKGYSIPSWVYSSHHFRFLSNLHNRR